MIFCIHTILSLNLSSILVPPKIALDIYWIFPAV